MGTKTVCALAMMAVGSVTGQVLTPRASAAGEHEAVKLAAPVLPSWMSGCWEQQSGAVTIEEFWMAPRGGVMLGMGRTSKGDAVVEFEHLRIFLRGDSLVYRAQPSAQPATEFVAPGVEREAITFSNPTHDFPQRVIYRRGGPDSLIARIEGTSSGRTRGIDFGYRRTRCPGA